VSESPLIAVIEASVEKGDRHPFTAETQVV
jgi:hypothetical protein